MGRAGEWSERRRQNGGCEGLVTWGWLDEVEAFGVDVADADAEFEQGVFDGGHHGFGAADEALGAEAGRVGQWRRRRSAVMKPRSPVQPSGGRART